MPESQSNLFIFAIGQPISLLVAYGFGMLVKRLLRGRVNLSGSAVAVVSLLGMSIGILLAIWVSGTIQMSTWLIFVWAFVVDVVILLLVSAVWARMRPVRKRATFDELVEAGESDTVEFKSSARCNMHTGKRDDRMEHVVAKTVAAFMNSHGGTLLLGVADDGERLGLAPDFGTLKTPDADRFELWLRDHLSTSFGRTAAAYPVVEFEPVPDGTDLMCRVSCPPAPQPVYLRPSKGSGTEFWVRVGNSTRLLDVHEAIDYVSNHWPARVRSLFRGRLRTWRGEIRP